MIAQFGTISSATFGLDFGELVVTKTRSGTTYAYPIELVRGFDGVWRIDGM